MLGKPRILSLFPNLFNKKNSIKHEHSCKILYMCIMDNANPIHFQEVPDMITYSYVLTYIDPLGQVKLCYDISNSYTMGCPPVRGDNPRALASGLSYVQVDKHGITILYHIHQCRPCTSSDISC